jgi:transposase-like protein
LPFPTPAGRVVADETWIGGEPSNRHVHKRGQGGQGRTDKTPVMSLVSRETGEVRSRVVPNVTGDSLCAVLTDHVDAATTHLHTDSSAYVKIGPKFAGHSFVDHLAGEYVRGDLRTNQAETYASQLKRSIDGTHHHVRREHVDRYLSEFDFDTARVATAIPTAWAGSLRRPSVAG